jgi:glycosyltransferase involved in cell wall biosynthesis
MVVGFLPSLRSGLGDLALTGQHTRLIDGYFRPYARAFEEIRYFSYLNESLADYTTDPELLGRARLFPGPGRGARMYATLMPFRYWPEFGGCRVFRVFQITGVVPALLGKWFRRIPFVTTYGFWYSDLSASRIRGRFRERIEAYGLRYAAAVIVTTPELAAHVAGRVGAGKVHLIPNGVDTDRFSPDPRPPNPVRQVLYVGRLSKEKNLSTLIAAAARLPNRIDARLIFIGQGPLWESLEAQARALGVRVDLLGVVDHRLLPRHFREADAFVLPSFTEGHPKTLLEAMSCGVPCVASARGGNRSTIRDGETGLLFEPDDVDGLALRLERVLTSEETARGLAAEARREVLHRYDLSSLVQKEIDLVRAVALAHG